MAKNVSNLFKDVIKNGGPFYCYATVVLSDGTELTLDSEKDFSIDGNSYDESSGSGFPLGVALSKSINIGILNADDRFSKYDFYMAKITLYTEADLSDGTKERIKEGTFTVTEPTASGELIDIVAYDDMYKANKEYTPAIQFPASALYVLQDVCGRCDMNLGSATFTNSDFQIEAVPEGLTCRQVIGFIAMIALGNAVCDANNRLVIKTYDFSLFETADIITGGLIGDDTQDSISGGEFGDALQDYISGGQFGDASNLHILSEFSSDPDICTDDVVITGIRMDVEDEEGNTSYILYGTRDYALNIDNDLVAGKEQEFVKMVGDKLIGVIIRPFSGSFFPDPTIEFMDPVYVIDRKDNIYQSFVCNHSLEYLGYSTISNELESPSRNDSAYQSGATEAYRKAREEAKKQRSEWEKAMEDLMNRVNNSSGLYTTEEEQPDGSTIYYMHDKPTLEESMIIWKMTAEAFAVSNDGGKTYSAGLTVDGNLIATIMSTIGINFDWGIGGTLIIRNEDGEEVVYMDADTGTVRMKVDSLSIAGKTPDEIAADKLQDFVESVYDPEIINLQAQIDGQIETYYYDYEPTLTNAPASDWTTEEDRAKHEGDLFYWKSKGYSYRFFKDGDTWKWQMVQDTDITKALATAAEAQDTADSKRRVFISTPVPPYDIGDLWAQGAAGDIMRCQNARQSGSFASSDWVKASKYTDDSALIDFIGGEFQETIETIKSQVDQKIDTWYQSTDPSTNWNASEKNEHIGDLWYDTNKKQSYRWNGTTWEAMESSGVPEDIYDKIDGKAQVFVNTPIPPYNVGDLWVQGAGGDIMKCKTARESGNYVSTDWEKASKYTDDTAVDELDKNLDMKGVFDRITENGTRKGIYIGSDGELYINATYIKSGVIDADLIEAGGITAGKIAANAITASKIASDAITSAKIRAGAVTATEIASGAITSSKIAAGAITAGMISSGTFTSDNEYRIKYNNSNYIVCIDSTVTPSSRSGVLSMGIVSGRAGYNPHINFRQGANNSIELISDDVSTYSDFTVNGDEEVVGISYLKEIRGRGSSGKELWIRANRDVSNYLRVSDGIMLPNSSGSYSLGQSNWPFATVAAREVVNTSRVEQKKDIEQLNHATSIVLGCDVCTYTWNDDVATQVVNSTPQSLDESSSETVEDKKSAGFVIGDGYNVDPLLLSNDGGGINLYSAIAVAYKAIQELNARCTELEQQIAELKGES